jgi:hypothetical protein
VLSRFLELLLPLPTAASTAIMAKRRDKDEELLARAKSNEKDSARDNGKHNKKTKTNQNVVLDRYVL